MLLKKNHGHVGNYVLNSTKLMQMEEKGVLNKDFSRVQLNSTKSKTDTPEEEKEFKDSIKFNSLMYKGVCAQIGKRLDYISGLNC